MATASEKAADEDARVGFTNIPLTDREHERFIKQDAAWTNGPKLVVTAFLTLAVAWTVLWLAANRYIGPEFHDGRPPAVATD